MSDALIAGLGGIVVGYGLLPHLVRIAFRRRVWFPSRRRTTTLPTPVVIRLAVDRTTRDR